MIYNKFFNYYFKNISFGYLSIFINTVISLGFLPIFINNIGIYNFSNWSLIYSAIILANILDLGISRYSASTLPNLKKIEDKELFISRCILICIGVFFLFLIVLFIVINSYGGIFNRLNNLNLIIKLLLLFNIFCFVFINLFKGILEGLYKLHFSTVSNTIINNSNLVVIGIISFYLNTLTIFFLIYSFFVFINLIIHIYLANKYISLKLNIVKFTLLISMIKKSMPFTLTALMDNLFFILIRLLIFEFSSNKSNIGYFEIISKISNFIKLIGSTSSKVFFSYFSDDQVSKIVKNKFIIYHIIMTIPLTALIIFSYINFGSYIFFKLFLLNIEDYYFNILFTFISFGFYGLSSIVYIYFLSFKKFKLLITSSLISNIFCLIFLSILDPTELNNLIFIYSLYALTFSVSLTLFYFYRKFL